MVRQAKAQRMLTHDQIWVALDRLAARAGLSPSGLAKRAGLDPTTFNRSKRVTSDGRERWPSTESIAKALAAADSSMATFVTLIDGVQGHGCCVPLLGFAEAVIWNSTCPALHCAGVFVSLMRYIVPLPGT